jgi:hypothetical protein
MGQSVVGNGWANLAFSPARGQQCAGAWVSRDMADAGAGR